MNKKILFKYVLMYIPMVAGIVLFCFGIINIISSLLLFLGGYIAIKNTFDYRMVKRNINSINVSKSSNIRVKDKDVGNIRLKRVKRNTRVRKREKY